MKKRHKIIVLAVAIDNYATGQRLNGCLNDLKNLLDYLNEWLDHDQYDLRLKILKDEAACKESVIETFLSYFGQLESGDTALFYFGGHGSQAYAPEVFWHDTPNQLHETLVCYDSRVEGNRDLYDKELSYLIWKVTNGKEIHFTVIADCCHSGSISRNLERIAADDQLGTRMLNSSKAKFPWQSYLGAGEYLESDKNVHVPVGAHIALSACRRTEKAKERILNYKTRGVFTFSLLEVLKQNGGRLTYGALMDRIQAKVYNIAIDQHPQMQAYGVADAQQQYFLGGMLRERERFYLVSHDNVKGWVFNQGMIHGLSQHDPSLPP